MHDATHNADNGTAICLSVCLSVYHDSLLFQNDYSYRLLSF